MSADAFWQHRGDMARIERTIREDERRFMLNLTMANLATAQQNILRSLTFTDEQRRALGLWMHHLLVTLQQASDNEGAA